MTTHCPLKCLAVIISRLAAIRQGLAPSRPRDGTAPASRRGHGATCERQPPGHDPAGAGRRPGVATWARCSLAAIRLVMAPRNATAPRRPHGGDVPGRYRQVIADGAPSRTERPGVAT
jgi:hypothetical protein